MSKKEILAVHEQKLKEFLEKLELWAPFSKGELKCRVCGVTISRENLGFIVPLKDKIVLCCSNADCIFRFQQLQGGEAKYER